MLEILNYLRGRYMSEKAQGMVEYALILAFVVLLIFGGKKIPELMKGIGKGVKSFKEGLREVDDEINKDE